MNIFELNRIRDERQLRRKLVFQNILKRCYRKIESISEKGLMSYCTYTVPKYVTGLPLYDQDQCTLYMMDELKRNGYYVTPTSPATPYTLYISWEHVPSSLSEPSISHLAQFKKSNPHLCYQEVIEQSENILPNDVLHQLKAPIVMEEASAISTPSYDQEVSYGYPNQGYGFTPQQPTRDYGGGHEYGYSQSHVSSPSSLHPIPTRPLHHQTTPAQYQLTYNQYDPHASVYSNPTGSIDDTNHMNSMMVPVISYQDVLRQSLGYQ